MGARWVSGRVIRQIDHENERRRRRELHILVEKLSRSDKHFTVKRLQKIYDLHIRDRDLFDGSLTCS